MSQSKEHSNQSPPPEYSSTAASTPVSTATTDLQLTPGLPFAQPPPAINFTQYRIGGAVLRDDHVAVLARDERFNRDPHTLLQLIHEQALLPPRLLVRIRGSHSVYGETKRDFDLTLNLLPLLVSEHERWSYLRIDGGRVTVNGERAVPAAATGPSDLEKLVVQYCEDPAPIKSFSLTRHVVNLDRDGLEGLIRNTVATTRYRGTLSIEFPLTFAEVVVQQGEVKKSLKDLFYWSMEPPAKKDPTKRYECVEVIWPFANVPANAAGRRCVVESEQSWWASWKDAVRSAVLAKRHGHVTAEDRIDVAMGIVSPEPTNDWGITK